MSWRTGIAVLSFFALVAVIQYPRVADYIREFTEPDQAVGLPAPRIAPPNQASTPATGTIQPSPRVVSDSDLTTEDLKLLALDYINEDRRLHGLEPVVMGDNEAAQLHAEDMVAGRYIGHWWLDGSKPYMVYSQTNGTSYVSENVARTGFSEAEFNELCTVERVSCDKVNPPADIQRLHHAMVYDDAESNWGHRDNVLNPGHRKVNIGIAYVDHFLAFVQHFEGGDVTAPQPPAFEGSNLKIRADLNIDDISVFPTIIVHHEPLPSARTGEEIGQFTSYCVGGGFTDECGLPIVEILPPPQPGTRYLNLPENLIVADSWVVSGGDIEIAADLGTLVSEPGVYTVSMFEDAGNGMRGKLLLQLSTFRG